MMQRNREGVWRDLPEVNLKIFRLNTVTYNTLLLIYFKLLDEGHKFPRAARVILEDTYVHDVITGVYNLGEALDFSNYLIALLKCCGFILKKMLKFSEILSNMPEESQLKMVKFEGSTVVKTLKNSWIWVESPL
ncbi:hypothetical protein LAZ67_8000895 [Cordylochernes scorpioides]|uniref:Uncharacterized protein n=1 Tax=Cordylochernes scorpioides TaxID=51811 RepID=A0ABY6KUT7_9ARAC|nr:hypothetical protein LAZ67_8000895 [Cordylochernes scorpioides]